MSPNTPANPTPLVRQATAREFLAVLFRRKWIILGLFLVTTATVLVVALSTPTYYQSSGRILVNRGERQSVLRPERQVFSEWEQELGSEIQVIRSATVVRRARELLEAESRRAGRALTLDPARIDVEVMGKSNVLAIGYVSLDPTLSQLACEAVMDAYIEYRKSRMTSEQPLKFFDDEIASIRRRIDQRLEERRRFTEATGVPVPLAQTQSWLTQLGSLETRRSEMAADWAAAQSVEQAMRRLQADPDIDLPTFDGVNQYTNEQALIQLKQKLLEQQTRIAFLTETLRDDAPEVVGARQTLETLSGLLRREVDARVRLAASRSQQLESKVAVLDRQIATIREELSAAPSKLTKTEEIDGDIAALRLRLREVSDSRDQALITANTMADINVVVLAPASVATPTNRLDVVRLLLAPAFSLLVGLAIAFFVDGLDLTVRTANQAEEYLDLPVLASMSDRRRRNG
jgi:uncharacterized protein involved in exopolysaccharide biosynthesis